MSQPNSKAQILKRLETERRRLEQNISGLSREEMLQPGVVGSWSVKDVLAHLADWQARMPAWLSAAQCGEEVETPAPGLTWKQLDILNQRIYEAHRDQSLEEILEYFHRTHDRFMKMVEVLPEEDMLARGHYAFVGKGSVYNWLGAFAAHDTWGKTQIRKWLKARGRLENTSRRLVQEEK